MPKKKKKPKVDGLGPVDKAYVRSAVRRIWRWSEARKIALARAKGYCELCNKKAGVLIKCDHIEPVGPVEGPFYVARMFVPSSKLQCLCKTCHDKKTLAEKK